MNNRHCLWLSLVALCWLGAAGAEAQLEPIRPSHRPLNNDLTKGASPEERLAGRLRRAGDLKRLGEAAKSGKLPPELAKAAEELLKNPELIEQLKKGLRPDQIEALREKIGNRDVPAGDPAFQKLLEQAKELARQHAMDGGGEGKLDGKRLEALEKWAKDLAGKKGGPNFPPGGPDNVKGPDGNKAGPNVPPGPPKGPEALPPMPPPPAPAPPEPPFAERLQERLGDWAEKNADKWIDKLDKRFQSPAGKSWRDALDRAVRRAPTGETERIVGRAAGLSKRLPSLGRFLPKNVSLPSFGRTGPPSLPRMRGSMPSVPAPRGLPTPGKGLAAVVLWGLAVVVFAFVLWRVGGWYQNSRAAGRAWRLGPWPVAPGEVSTRGELVRAFEYLALLALGPSARTAHHLELGNRLGEQPAADPDRRREAAEELARLYERARYAPENEPLAPNDLATARRELCYLAGVSAA